MINGERVRQAREFSGLTQTELSDLVGILQPQIARIEMGYKQPSSIVLEQIVLHTGFPMAFFRRSAPPNFPLGSLLFRSQASMTSRERQRVHRYGQILLEIVDTVLLPHIRKIELRLPRISKVSPNEAASIARAELGLSPNTPVKHLLNVIERAGVFIFALPTSFEAGDAFSVWAEYDVPKPIIALSDGKPGDRLRFNCSHELGHLIMHASGMVGTPDKLHSEANEFAAEFLMPADIMREEISAPVTLSALAQLKPRWGVSIQALITRARDLKIISQRQYKYLFEQLGALGWRKCEPKNLDVPIERPRAFRKMVELVYGNPINYERFAADTNLTIRLLKRITEAYAPAPVPKSPSDNGNIVSMMDRSKKTTY